MAPDPIIRNGTEAVREPTSAPARVAELADRGPIVSGEVIAENGVPTAARPGRLIRGRQPAPAS